MDYNVYVAIKKVCECYFYYQIKFSIQIQRDSVFLPSRSFVRSLERLPTSMVTLSCRVQLKRNTLHFLTPQFAVDLAVLLSCFITNAGHCKIN